MDNMGLGTLRAKLASLRGRAVQWRFPQSEPVAQLVEHRTFNAVVAGSSPARLTIISSLASAPTGYPDGPGGFFALLHERSRDIPRRERDRLRPGQIPL